VKVLRIKSAGGRIDLQELLNSLYGIGIRSLLVEGGSAAASSCTSGDCGACTLSEPRECFPSSSSISTAGLASPGYPVLAGAACVSGTGFSFVDNPVGLVGPERLILQTRTRFFCASDPAKTYEPGTGGCP